jgi:hypothetical protein
MFGSSWFLRPEMKFVCWSPEIENEDSAHDSGSAIERGLDRLGLGVWNLSHTGGGCYAYDCLLSDGSYLMVSSGDVLSRYGDSDDFHEGSVTVGLYVSDDRCDDFVIVHNSISPDGDRESAIVSAVGEVLVALGLSADGIDWGKVSAFVADALCAWCVGVGHKVYNGKEYPCSCSFRGVK